MLLDYEYVVSQVIDGKITGDNAVKSLKEVRDNIENFDDIYSKELEEMANRAILDLEVDDKNNLQESYDQMIEKLKLLVDEHPWHRFDSIALLILKKSDSLYITNLIEPWDHANKLMMQHLLIKIQKRINTLDQLLAYSKKMSKELG